MSDTEKNESKNEKIFMTKAYHNCQLCKREWLGRCMSGEYHGEDVSVKNRAPYCHYYSYGGTELHLKEIEYAESLGVKALTNDQLHELYKSLANEYVESKEAKLQVTVQDDKVEKQESTFTKVHKNGVYIDSVSFIQKILEAIYSEEKLNEYIKEYGYVDNPECLEAIKYGMTLAGLLIAQCDKVVIKEKDEVDNEE